jgi:riboflavin synthase
MMFTGIVEEIGVVRDVHDTGGDLRVTIGATEVPQDLRIGDSVSVSGCCLTVVAVTDGTFEVELSKETVAKTAPRWRTGCHVDLERATRLGDRLGGHLVSGHVEGTGLVTAIDAQPGAHVLTVRAPEALARYLIPKGSITVDGVSLTVVDVGGPGGSSATLPATDFTLWLIPHTLAVTTLGELRPGDLVNLEADLVAKYLERLVATSGTRTIGAADARVPDPPAPPDTPPVPDPPAPPPAPPVPDPPDAGGERHR